MIRARSGLARVITLTLGLAILAACASARPIVPLVTRIEMPPVGEERLQELGDTLVAKGQIRTYDALVVSDSLTYSQLGVDHIYPPQTFLARNEDDDWVYFGAGQARVMDLFFGEIGWTPYSTGIARSKKNPGEFRHYYKAGVVLGELQMPAFTAQKVEIAVENSFRRELIYNGRTGSTVKFLYREAAGGSLRSDFSQDVQYDLSESTLIGFKGARIEVLEASNANIRYRVLSNFPD